MIYLFFLIVLVVLFIAFLVNTTLVSSVNRLSKPESLFKMLAQANGSDQDYFIEAFADYQDNDLLLDSLLETQGWAQGHSFETDIVFDFYGVLNGLATRAAVWRNTAKKQFLVLYYDPNAKKILQEFSSGYLNNKSLTTSSSRDSLALPPAPDNYIQVFENLDLNELYAKHLDSEERLYSEDIIQTNNQEMAQNTIYYILTTLKKQSEYVKTIPFWQHKGFYWYFVRRNHLVNKAISI